MYKENYLLQHWKSIDNLRYIDFTKSGFTYKHSKPITTDNLEERSLEITKTEKKIYKDNKKQMFLKEANNQNLFF
jgi:hypothetical protein